MQCSTDHKLRRSIRQFEAHEITPVDAVFGVHSIDEVLDNVDWNLRHCQVPGILNTLTFIRDASLYAHPLKRSFRKKLRNSVIWKELRKLLYHRHSGVRNNAIYTIGKLFYRNKAKLLIEAFPHYLKTDPVNLGGLMSELRWLTKRWNWRLLEQIAEAPHYLHRWSLCSNTYRDLHGSDDIQRFVILFQKLATDPHPKVSAEAACRYKVLQVTTTRVSMSGRELRATGLSKSITYFDDAIIRLLSLPQPHTMAKFERLVAQMATGRLDQVD